MGGFKIISKFTKIQIISGSLTTTIPATIRDTLELEKGDSLEWNIEDNKIIIKKVVE